MAQFFRKSVLRANAALKSFEVSRKSRNPAKSIILFSHLR